LKVVIATWDAGGVTQPAIGLGRLMAERGHDVRVLAPVSLTDRIMAAGARPRAWPPGIEFDASRGRAIEEQLDGWLTDILLGPGLPAAVRGELATEPADVVVVDYLLRSALIEVERSHLPLVPLVHQAFRAHGVLDDEDPDATWGWRWEIRQINRIRQDVGLDSLPLGPESARVALLARSLAAVVVMPREFDDWPAPPPSVVHVGPIFEESNEATWESPWPSGDPRPLIVVSLGTTYMHQEGLLRRIADALGELDARVLVLTGSALEPDEIVGLATSAEIRSYVPHAAVLPDAALLVTHAGMGSLMAAFAAGVPTICLPIGRDQRSNAERAAELGTSITLSRDASSSEIYVAVERALRSPEMRRAAVRMQESIASYGEGRLAVETLERVGSRPPETDTVRTGR
jgi:MGT family glycosyltransferase